MGSFRQGVAHSNVQTPLLIVGGLLLVVVLLAIFQQQLRRRRHKQYHPALELQSTGVLGQIQRRKSDLNRFIGRLRSQLEIREQQLRLHDELEDVVTARVETGRRQDQEWDEIMRAGKKLHGKKWTQPAGDDRPSLKELMEMHKDELLELKATVARGAGSKGSGRRREKRQSTRQSVQVMQLPTAASEETASLSPRVVPPQWQSTRRTAGSLSRPPAEPTRVASKDENPWSKNTFQRLEPGNGVPAVPKLDLARLNASPLTPEMARVPATKPTKSFEEMFQRQAKLASSLKQQKKKA